MREGKLPRGRGGDPSRVLQCFVREVLESSGSRVRHDEAMRPLALSTRRRGEAGGEGEREEGEKKRKIKRIT